MRKLILSSIPFLLLTEFVLIYSQGQSLFKSSCENRANGYATAGMGPADEGYCELERKDYNPPKFGCMRAAVVDYSRVNGADCKSLSQQNLDAFEKIVELAREDGAKMIVFPEDGIVMCTARCMLPCLEEIPDPNTLADDYNPCLQPNRFGQHFAILTRLSCLARKHGVYLIANYGTKEKRATFNETNNLEVGSSPEGKTNLKQDDKYMMLNTDVIFEPTGNFIRRYRKWNPFTETEIFEKAPRLEHVYFDTDYGRFGVFTCFDMLFREPAIELVEKYRIDTALFPTWWFDELPLLTAVQFQDGWSARNEVNLLAANILNPSLGSLGSSIFSGNNSIYASPQDYKADKQVRKTKILLGTIQTSKSGEMCKQEFNPKMIEFDTNTNHDKYRHKNYKLHAGDTVRVLDLSGGEQTVCSGKLCCRVVYKMASQSASDMSSSAGEKKRLVVLVRDGPRPGFYKWYEQVCAVATMKKPCNQCHAEQLLKNLEFDGDAAIGFERLSIEGVFDTSYVYPASGHSLSKLVNRNQRKFGCNQLSNQPLRFNCRLDYVANNTNAETNKLYSFGLYGRVHERDMKR